MNFYNKPIIAAAAVAVVMSAASCSGAKKTAETPAEPETTPAQELIARLDSTVQSSKFFFGHHDDTAYGHTWEYVDSGSDVRAVTGEYPGLMSWDLGMIELDSAKNLDGVPFEFIAAEIAKQNARSGINAISWHPLNPATGGNSWDVSAEPIRNLASNKAMQDSLTAWISNVADFIGSLKDADGNLIPVIFRPWHENSGSWFWWGKDHASAQDYIGLWHLTRKVFDEKGINNVVWAYSPDKDLTPGEYFSTYPGDDYVDILGTDIYHFGGEQGVEEYTQRIRKQLPFVCEEAAKRGKIAAFTETGLESLEIADWYTRVLMPAIQDLPIAYVCVWRNAVESQNPRHFYAPYPGHPAEKDFKAFHDNPKTIFVK